MIYLSGDTQADAIEALASTSRYLDDFSNIDNLYFEGMVSQIYPGELPLNKAITSDIEASFINFRVSEGLSTYYCFI